MKCPKCGKKIHKVPNYNPSTKQVEGFRLTHIYTLGEVLSRKATCYYTERVS